MSKAQPAPAADEMEKDEIDLLPSKQQTALVSLLRSKSVKEAADECGISEATLWRYLRDPAFSEHYRRLRREAVGQAVMRLQADSSAAVQVLSDVAQDAAAPPAARVAAARVIVGLAFKGLELGDLQDRIASLEEYIRRKAEQDELRRGRGDDEEDDEE